MVLVDNGVPLPVYGVDLRYNFDFLGLVLITRVVESLQMIGI